MEWGQGYLVDISSGARVTCLLAWLPYCSNIPGSNRGVQPWTRSKLRHTTHVTYG